MPEKITVIYQLPLRLTFAQFSDQQVLGIALGTLGAIDEGGRDESHDIRMSGQLFVDVNLFDDCVARLLVGANQLLQGIFCARLNVLGYVHKCESAYVEDFKRAFTLRGKFI